MLNEFATVFQSGAYASTVKNGESILYSLQVHFEKSKFLISSILYVAVFS